MEKVTYSISINRPGMGDLPELCATDAPFPAAEIVRALLSANDRNIASITINVVRIAGQYASVP